MVICSGLNAEKLQRHERGVQAFVRLVPASEIDILSKRGLTQENVRSVNECVTSRVAFYKKNLCSALRGEMSVCQFKTLFCSSRKVPQIITHLFAMGWEQMVGRGGQEQVVRSENSDVV